MGLRPREDLRARFTATQANAGPQTSKLGQLGRGFATDTPAGIGALLDLASRAAGFLATGADVVGREPFFEAGARKGSELAIGPDVLPQTPGQRRLRALGRGTGLSLATLPLGGGALSAGKAALSAASGAAGELASSETEAAGGGLLAQIAAGTLGSLGVGALGKLGANMASNIAQGASSTVRNRKAARIVAQVLGREVTDKDEALRLIQQEIDTPLFGNATTAQILEDVAPGVHGLEKGAGLSSLAASDLRRELHRTQVANARAAEEFADAAFGAGRPGAALSDYAKKLQRIRDKVQRAYMGRENLAGIPTHKLKATVAQLRLNAGDELRKHLPEEQLANVERYGATVDLNSLKRLRTALGEELRDKTLTPSKERNINQLIDGIEETYREVAEAGGAEAIDALKRANRIRAIEGARFDPKDPLNQILGGEFENLPKRFSAFLNNAKRPVDALERTRLTLGDNPEAWAGVQKLMRDEVFGEGFSGLFDDLGKLTAGGASRSLKRLNRHAAAFDVVYGAGAADNARRFLRRAEKLSSGVVGKTREFSVTAAGLDVQDVPTKLAQAGIVGDIVRRDYRSAAIRAFHLATGQLPKTLEEADKLLAAALADPSIARGFLEQLPGDAIPIWQRAVKSSLTAPTRVGVGVLTSEGF